MPIRSLSDRVNKLGTVRDDTAVIGETWYVWYVGVGGIAGDQGDGGHQQQQQCCFCHGERIPST